MVIILRLAPRHRIRLTHGCFIIPMPQATTMASRLKSTIPTVAIETHVSIPFLSDVKVRSLSPVELFATKINALIGRSAARDIYDVYNMVKHQLFVSDEEKTLLRKAIVFYLTVGSSRKDNATPTEYTAFPQIDKIRFPQIRSQLLPVLRCAVSILTLKKPRQK